MIALLFVVACLGSASIIAVVGAWRWLGFQLAARRARREARVSWVNAILDIKEALARGQLIEKRTLDGRTVLTIYDKKR